MNVFDILDARWWVPASYYDLYRPWYGRLHRDLSWMTFERQQLLVIGPAQRSKDQSLSGTVCLYDKPAAGCGKQQHGYYSWVYDRWCRPQCMLTYRLVPIELCDLIEDTELHWLAKLYLPPI